MATSVEITSPESGANAPEQQQQQQPPSANPAEAWRPAGFTGTQADLAKSWADQRAEITRLQQAAKGQPAAPDDKPADDSSTPPNAAPKIEEPKPTNDAAQDVVEAAGLDVAPFQQEYDTTGDVSEESRAHIARALEKQLGPNARAIVDQFIESQKVVHTNDRQMYMEAAGGEQQFNTMLQWAKQSLTPQEIAAYNAQVASRDRHATLFAIEGLRARYEKANGRVPQRVLAAGRPVNGSVQPFKSAYEMTQAMNDPRYARDENFRNEVRERLALSQF